MKRKEEEEQELVFGQRFEDYNKFKKTGIDASTFESKEEKPAPKSKIERFNERFVKGERGKLLRRGTPTAQRAEIKERNRKRAQAAATKRRTK
tara:strand:- start:53 stop:331 length:279 start_codon:yes stop_codon:yes gene_type:complete